MPKYEVKIIVRNIDNEAGDDTDDSYQEFVIEAANRQEAAAINGNVVEVIKSAF